MLGICLREISRKECKRRTVVCSTHSHHLLLGERCTGRCFFRWCAARPVDHFSLPLGVCTCVTMLDLCTFIMRASP